MAVVAFCFCLTGHAAVPDQHLHFLADNARLCCLRTAFWQAGFLYSCLYVSCNATFKHSKAPSCEGLHQPTGWHDTCSPMNIRTGLSSTQYTTRTSGVCCASTATSDKAHQDVIGSTHVGFWLLLGRCSGPVCMCARVPFGSVL